MTNNYDNYGYENDEDQGRGSFVRRLVIVLMVVCAIILVMFLVKGCGNRSNPTPETKTFDYENVLLEGGKKYFDVNYDKYPKNSGECEEIELQALIERSYVKAEDFSKCNTNNTYVKVCKMENGSYHFYPWLVCSDKNSSDEYGAEMIGTASDIIPNKTIVSFRFLPQKYEEGNAILGDVEEIWKDDIKYEAYKTLSSTTYYRYRDKLFKWTLTNKYYYTSKGEVTDSSKVKEYYPTTPNSKYTLSDSKTTGYKWYTSSAKKVYALDANGVEKFSHSQISGYQYNDNGVCVEYQTRTLTGTSKANHYYKCAKSKNSTTIAYQLNTKCGSEPNAEYSYQLDEFYTCGYGQYDEIESMRVSSANVQCNTYSTWKNSLTACDTSLPTCRKIEPYCVYNWYRIEENANKKYIPSGSSSASGEKMYYVSSPSNNAIKDETTATAVYKWYRTVNSVTNSYTALAPTGYSEVKKTGDSKWSDWSDYSKSNPKVSDGRTREIESKVKIKLQQIKGTTNEGWKDLTDQYMSLDELITYLKSKNYNVSTLSDIDNIGELKVKLQMFVKNKKENK